MAWIHMLFTLKVTAMVIAVVAIIANSLVCHVIVRLKTMKTPINYIILSIAILDAMTGFLSIVYIPLNEYGGVLVGNMMELAYNQTSILAEVLCKLNWLYCLGLNTSTFLFTIMAYERYKAIVYPFTRLHGRVSKAKLKRMLPLAWLIRFSLSCFEMAIVTYDPILKLCSFTRSYVCFNKKVYVTIYSVVVFIIPSTILLVLYVRVICALRKSNNALNHEPQALAKRARHRAIRGRKRVSWIIIIMSLVFFICAGFPHILYPVYFLLEIEVPRFEIFHDICTVLLAFNSAFNPFVYLVCINSFRTGLKKVLAFKNGRNKRFRNPRIKIGAKRSMDVENTPSSNFANRCGSNREVRLVTLAFANMNDNSN